MLKGRKQPVFHSVCSRHLQTDPPKFVRFSPFDRRLLPATAGTAGPAIQVRDGAEPPLSVPSVAFRPEEEIWVDGVEVG